MVIGFAYGVINSIVLGRSEARVTWEMLVLICALTLGFTVQYASQTETWPQRFREFFQNRGFYELGLASSVAMLALSFARYIPITKVQAFSLDLRLRQAISQPYSSPDSYRDIDTVVSAARAKNVPLKPGLVNAAGGWLITGSRTDPTAWQSALTVLGYKSYLNKVQSVVPPTSAGCFDIGQSDGIKFEVSTVTLECSQKLDHAAWKNVHFVNSTILYDGGPLLLKDVTFENCRFELNYSANSQKLADALLGSNVVNIELR